MESIFALLGINVAAGYGPIVGKIISAVANVRIDKSIDKTVKELF